MSSTNEKLHQFINIEKRREAAKGVIAQFILFCSFLLSGGGLIKLYSTPESMQTENLTVTALITVLLALNFAFNLVLWNWFVRWISTWQVVIIAADAIYGKKALVAHLEADIERLQTSVAALEKDRHRLTLRVNELTQSRATANGAPVPDRKVGSRKLRLVGHEYARETNIEPRGPEQDSHD